MPSSLPEINDLELQSRSLDHMARPKRIRIQICLTVRVEQAFLIAVQYVAQSWWIREPEDTPIWVVARCADYGYRLRQHDLVARAGM